MRAVRSYWREFGLTMRFFGIDARAFFPLLFALYRPAKWSFGLAGVAIVAFFIMEKKGYTLPVLIRLIRHKMRGSIIHARAWWHHRRNYE